MKARKHVYMRIIWAVVFVWTAITTALDVNGIVSSGKTVAIAVAILIATTGAVVLQYERELRAVNETLLPRVGLARGKLSDLIDEGNRLKQKADQTAIDWLAEGGEKADKIRSGVYEQHVVSPALCFRRFEEAAYGFARTVFGRTRAERIMAATRGLEPGGDFGGHFVRVFRELEELKDKFTPAEMSETYLYSEKVRL